MFDDLKTELKTMFQTKIAWLLSGLFGGSGIDLPGFFHSIKSFFGF